MAQRYTDVQFEIVSLAGDSYAYRGTVIVRDGEMLLEVECPDERPYVIRGKASCDFFQGRHEGLLGDPSVQAKWIRLDDIYIGTWLEEGIDYLFKFCLSIEATEA